MNNQPTENISEEPSANEPQALEAMVRELTHAIEAEGNVRTVFGEPVLVEKHRIVPIATIEIGAGAGGLFSRRGPMRLAQEAAALARRFIPAGWGIGGGGGGMLRVRPVGFLQEEDGRVVFCPISVDGEQPRFERRRSH
jgi:uncharacterized spore protein YtfJ